MNQILICEKVYVTQKLKRKKRFYKIQFVLSILIVLCLLIYYAYSEYDKYKGESIGQELKASMPSERINKDDDTLVVAVNDTVDDTINEIPEEQPNQEPAPEEQQVLDQFNTVHTTNSGKKYKVDSVLNIPSLEINYPVLSESTDELLKISLNKFWGGEPNSIGNYCVVGHNYDGKDIFFGKLYRIQNGDIVELEDKSGNVLQYKVYNKFIVKPTDTACTSQITNGRKEMTLITCSDGGKTRLIVKCRAIE